MQLINPRNMEHQTVQGQFYKRGVLKFPISLCAYRDVRWQPISVLFRKGEGYVSYNKTIKCTNVKTSSYIIFVNFIMNYFLYLFLNCFIVIIIFYT
jgi:hypothetical protein